MRPRHACRLFTLTLCLLTCTAAAASESAVTHGIAAGEITDTSAVLWTRCSSASDVRFEVRPEPKGGLPPVPARAADDFTAQIAVTGLAPRTAYTYSARCAPGAAPVTGRFVTAPPANEATAVRFAWGGDLGGQNVCRDAARGYFVFDAIAAQRPDFFVALGDMIYADDPCRPVGLYGNPQIPGPPSPAGDLATFRAYWRYNRADAAFQRFLATVPTYAVWDDHEVANDVGPHHDSGRFTDGRHLLPLGLTAFLDYNPLRPVAGADNRLYRRVRWGRNLELFLLDTRQYRDANGAADSVDHPKSMLGPEQRAWLERSLVASDATWRVIVTSVPLSFPTGGPTHPADSWANGGGPGGFARELQGLLAVLRAHDMRNVVWISTDIHFTTVFRLRPFSDAPDLVTYEIETGPLNSGVFPRPKFDATFGAAQLFRYPEPLGATPTFAAAARGFTFGVMRIDDAGAAAIDVVTALGETVYTLPLPRP